jgi:RNA polymerase sigma factor (sigma-70 family)
MPANAYGLILRRLRGLVAVEGDSDAALLARFVQARDESAFAALVRRHGPLVLGLGRRWLGQQQDAEDVFQATFLVLARKAGSVRNGQSLGSFLYGVALRLAHKARADAARHRCPPADEPAVSADPLESLSARELLQALDEELSGLPERYRAPLLLCHLQGRTQDEAASELGWSKATLRRRLARGRTLLRARLAGRGITAPAALAAAQAAAEASVPVALAEVILRGTRWFLSGQGPAASAAAATLAEHGMRLLAGPKLKGFVGLAVTLFLVSLTLGMAGDQARSPEPGATAAAPKPEGQASLPRRDLFGDPLPPGAVARLGSLRFRTGSRGWLGFSPDGKTVGVCRSLWDPATGKKVREIQAEPTHPFGAYSADFRVLATWGGERLLQMWDVATGRQLPSLKGDVSWISVAAFSADGRRLVTGRHGDNDRWTVCVWDLADGREVARLKRETFSDLYLALSPDGRTLAEFAWRNGGVLSLLDVATGKDVRPFPVRMPQEWNSSGRGVVFSPDGKSLVAYGALWDVASGRRRADLPDLFGPNAWSPDGKTLASGPHLLDVAAGKFRDLEGAPGSLGGAAFSPDGKTLAAMTQGGTLRLWDTATAAQLNRIEGHQAIVSGLALSHDGHCLASVGFDSTLRLWDATNGRERRCRRLDGAAFGSPDYLVGPRLALSPDDRVVAVCLGNIVSLRDAATGDEVRRLAGHEAFVTSLAFAPDGSTLATASRDFTVRLWDPATGREVRRLEGHRGEVDAVAFSPDGRLLASGGADHTLCLWDPATGRERGLVGWQKSGVRLLAFAADRTTMAAVNTAVHASYMTAGPVHLWDLTTGRELGTRGPKDRHVGTFALSPDGRTLATNGDNSVDCWDLASGKLLRKLSCSPAFIVSLAFSSDGRRLASACSDTTVLVWDVEDLKMR